ncbi:uncharacterized protein L969DRAFT_97200 [Mixia osmundae IAM 14324]|uniref:Uncharacterized protein n=1 Tax=Mixia osmundae (strain CBS 9802 / IAM 14324 / JCM 22182 / KY 12970) TaxID=764103 RepID=G7DW31_MIXOS|nr:uncharacterized protein L969DRAFT_97200 [Mixia osmundae IAM 14324]KEI36463.1 hypothetical protein L969DRAFT_97200 [Mixia osmundae IAM 14324]GAA94837.1 hypothetical protein E5Q_01491 [Mixia osmundae IAM 14324]
MHKLVLALVASLALLNFFKCVQADDGDDPLGPSDTFSYVLRVDIARSMQIQYGPDDRYSDVILMDGTLELPFTTPFKKLKGPGDQGRHNQYYFRYQVQDDVWIKTSSDWYFNYNISLAWYGRIPRRYDYTDERWAVNLWRDCCRTVFTTSLLVNPDARPLKIKKENGWKTTVKISCEHADADVPEPYDQRCINFWANHKPPIYLNDLRAGSVISAADDPPIVPSNLFSIFFAVLPFGIAVPMQAGLQKRDVRETAFVVKMWSPTDNRWTSLLLVSSEIRQPFTISGGDKWYHWVIPNLPEYVFDFAPIDGVSARVKNNMKAAQWTGFYDMTLQWQDTIKTDDYRGVNRELIETYADCCKIHYAMTVVVNPWEVKLRAVRINDEPTFMKLVCSPSEVEFHPVPDRCTKLYQKWVYDFYQDYQWKVFFPLD